MRISIAAIALAIVTAFGGSASAGQGSDAGSRVFELRTYTTGPGQVNELNRRFREYTANLLRKHGMTLVGFWIPTDKPDTFVYLISHQSRAAAEEAWKAMLANPEFLDAQKAANAKNPVTVKVDSIYMSATDYSPLK
jgi:hypothetical protein